MQNGDRNAALLALTSCSRGRSPPRGRQRSPDQRSASSSRPPPSPCGAPTRSPPGEVRRAALPRTSHPCKLLNFNKSTILSSRHISTNLIQFTKSINLAQPTRGRAAGRSRRRAAGGRAATAAQKRKLRGAAPSRQAGGLQRLDVVLLAAERGPEQGKKRSQISA